MDCLKKKPLADRIKAFEDYVNKKDAADDTFDKDDYLPVIIEPYDKSITISKQRLLARKSETLGHLTISIRKYIKTPDNTPINEKESLFVMVYDTTKKTFTMATPSETLITLKTRHSGEEDPHVYFKIMIQNTFGSN